MDNNINILSYNISMNNVSVKYNWPIIQALYALHTTKTGIVIYKDISNADFIDMSGSGRAQIIYDASDNKVKISENGGSFVPIVQSIPVPITFIAGSNIYINETGSTVVIGVIGNPIFNNVEILNDLTVDGLVNGEDLSLYYNSVNILNSRVNQSVNTTSTPTFQSLFLNDITPLKFLVAGSSSKVSSITPMHWDPTNTRIGLGTTTPQTSLDIVTDSGTSSASFRLYKSINTDNLIFAYLTNSPASGDDQFRFVTARGSGNNVGSVVARCGLTHGNSFSSMINFHRSGGATDGYISFSTNNNTTRLVIDRDGYLCAPTGQTLSFSNINSGNNNTNFTFKNGTTGTYSINVSPWSDGNILTFSGNPTQSNRIRSHINNIADTSFITITNNSGATYDFMRIGTTALNQQGSVKRSGSNYQWHNGNGWNTLNSYTGIFTILRTSGVYSYTASSSLMTLPDFLVDTSGWTDSTEQFNIQWTGGTSYVQITPIEDLYINAPVIMVPQLISGSWYFRIYNRTGISTGTPSTFGSLFSGSGQFSFILTVHYA